MPDTPNPLSTTRAVAPPAAAGRVLPEWPARTIAILTTIGRGPHAIPISAPVRAGEHRILFSLHRDRGSLARLRQCPQVALAILAEGDVAFTARGYGHVVQEPLASAPDYVAVAIEVTEIDDHRQTAFEVQSGIGRRWRDDAGRDALGRRVRALGLLAAPEATGCTRRSGAPAGVSLRDATTADAPRLSDVVHAAYRHYVDRLGVRPRPMEDDHARVVAENRVTVAVRGREIVGLVVLRDQAGSLLVDNIAVVPGAQGAGIGRALLEHAEATARREGRDAIGLCTHELMVENRALYARIGYVEQERSPEMDAPLIHLRKLL